MCFFICIFIWVSPAVSAETLLVKSASAETLAVETRPDLKHSANVQSIPNAIALFKENEQKEYADIGKVELLKYQCLPVTANQTEEQKVKPACVVLWQWMDNTTWDVSLSVIDNKGNTLDSEGFGRSAMLLGVVPYSTGSLIIIEYGVQQVGDVSCCPSKMHISVFRWFKGKLQRLSESELAETNRHP